MTHVKCGVTGPSSNHRRAAAGPRSISVRITGRCGVIVAPSRSGSGSIEAGQTRNAASGASSGEMKPAPRTSISAETIQTRPESSG